MFGQRRRPRARGSAGRAAGSTLVSVDLDPHRAGEHAADRMLARVEAHEHRPAERLAVDDLEVSAQTDAELGQVAEHLRVGIGHANEPSRGTDRELVEAAGRALVDLEQGRRDRIAVRIDRRMTEPLCDQLLELLGEDVLEHLRLGMHPIPRHPELLSEEQLEQTVMAQHLQSNTAALVGQAHTVIGLMLDDPDLGQLAHHPRHRRRGHPEPGREIVRRYRCAATSLQRIQRLRVILHRRRNRLFSHHHTKIMARLIIRVKASKTTVCRPALRVSRGPSPRRAAPRRRRGQRNAR